MDLSRRALRRCVTTTATAAVLACTGVASANHQPDGSPTTDGLTPPAEPDPGPSISGTPQDGETLTADRGTWEAGTEITSEWLRCDSGLANCVRTHDTDLTYVLSAGDVGSRIVLRVKGTDAGPFPLGGSR